MTARLRILFVIACAIASGCAREDSSDDTVDRASLTSLKEPENALDEHLMVALGQAKNFHHKADVYVQEHNPEQAIQSVELILSIDFPENSPEAEDVLLDARARLGKLMLAKGDLERAWDIVEEGVASAKRESFFLANLHTVRGEVLKARAAALQPTDAEAAKELKRQAIEAYDRSIQIGDELLEKIKSEGDR